MMKTLYIFPHPDDESFGPAPVIYRQTKRGEEVHLLTFTKGGATKQRFKYNLSVGEMGEIRFKEMLKVKEVLNLTSMEVLDFPDGGMGQMDPLEIERTIKEHIDRVKPDIIVTYAIHGISGHHDHLACHAAVKRVFCELRQKQEYNFLKRLALFTFPGKTDKERLGGNSHIRSSKPEWIDCIVRLNDEEIKILSNALYCYETYKEVIESTGVIDAIGDKVHFECFDEDFKPNIEDITAGLK